MFSKVTFNFLNSWQLKKCVCLKQIPNQRSRGANDCSWSCSIKTNLKFQNDCGGDKTYSLFKSGTFFMIYSCIFLTKGDEIWFKVLNSLNAIHSSSVLLRHVLPHRVSISIFKSCVQFLFFRIEKTQFSICIYCYFSEYICCKRFQNLV